jgi:hypothetical protein
VEIGFWILDFFVDFFVVFFVENFCGFCGNWIFLVETFLWIWLDFFGSWETFFVDLVGFAEKSAKFG